LDSFFFRVNRNFLQSFENGANREKPRADCESPNCSRTKLFARLLPHFGRSIDFFLCDRRSLGITFELKNLIVVNQLCRPASYLNFHELKANNNYGTSSFAFVSSKLWETIPANHS